MVLKKKKQPKRDEHRKIEKDRIEAGSKFFFQIAMNQLAQQRVFLKGDSLLSESCVKEPITAKKLDPYQAGSRSKVSAKFNAKSHELALLLGASQILTKTKLFLTLGDDVITQITL